MTQARITNDLRSDGGSVARIMTLTRITLTRIMMLTRITKPGTDTVSDNDADSPADHQLEGLTLTPIMGIDPANHGGRGRPGPGIRVPRGLRPPSSDPGQRAQRAASAPEQPRRPCPSLPATRTELEEARAAAPHEP